MVTNNTEPLKTAIGPDGSIITEADLPPASTKRWVMNRKAIVVAGVKAGLISLEAACARYSLSKEEFESWQAMIEQHGIRALRTTRVQQYRNSDQQKVDGAPNISPFSAAPKYSI